MESSDCLLTVIYILSLEFFVRIQKKIITIQMKTDKLPSVAGPSVPLTDSANAVEDSRGSNERQSTKVTPNPSNPNTIKSQPTYFRNLISFQLSY